MYKSNHIRYNQYSNFGLMSAIGSRLLSDDPGTIINQYKELGKIKNKLTKPIENPTLTQRLDSLAGDAGAVTGVLGTALGGGIKQYLPKVFNKTGERLKQWGINTVVDDGRRINTGRNVLAGAGVLGVGGLGAAGLVGASKLADAMNEKPEEEYIEYVEYQKARWRTVDFYL